MKTQSKEVNKIEDWRPDFWQFIHGIKDGNESEADFEKWLEVLLRQVLQKQREEIEEKARLLKIEYADTPLNKRGNVWDWIDKLINSLNK